MPGDVSHNEGTRFKRIFSTWVDIITATVITNQKKSLNFLTRVILDNRIDLDHIPAKQGGVCPIINTSYCT